MHLVAVLSLLLRIDCLSRASIICQSADRLIVYLAARLSATRMAHVSEMNLLSDGGVRIGVNKNRIIAYQFIYAISYIKKLNANKIQGIYELRIKVPSCIAIGTVLRCF